MALFLKKNNECELELGMYRRIVMFAHEGGMFRVTGIIIICKKKLFNR